MIPHSEKSEKTTSSFDPSLTARLASISHQAPGIIYQYKMFPDGRACFPYANDAIKHFFGVNPEDLREDASPVFALMHPDDVSHVKTTIRQSAQTMKDWRCEFRVQLPGKEDRWLLGHSRPVLEADGSILWSGFITDISSRVKNAIELLKTSRLYAVTAQINQMVIHSKNRDELFLEACKIVVNEGKFHMAWIGMVNPKNQLLEPVASYGVDDGYLKRMRFSTSSDLPEGHGLSGKAFRERRVVVDNDLENSASFGLWKVEALSRGYASSIALPIFFKGMSVGTLNIYSSVKMFFTRPEIELLEKISMNISYAIEALDNQEKHRQYEEALRQSEKNYRTIFEGFPLGIASISSSTGLFLSTNHVVSTIFMRSKEELQKITWMSIVHPDDLSKCTTAMSQLDKKEKADFKYPIRMMKPDGTYVWVDFSAVALYGEHNDEKSVSMLCMIEDISERKINEEKLKKSEEMFSAIAALSPDIISILNEKGEIRYSSPASLRLHGYKTEDLLGRSTLDLVHPDERSLIHSEFQRILSHPGLYTTVQYRYLNKDGSYSWMEATAVNQLKNPLIEGVISISRDINQRKKLEEELRSALATRDEFLSIASHELKTPITSLKLQLQILSRRIHAIEGQLTDPEIILKSIISSLKQVNRVTDLVENLLDVSRIEAGKLMLNLERINLSELINELIDRSKELFSESDSELILSIEPDIFGSWDKGRIEQVFVNLISNSLKYAPGRPVSITLKRMNDLVRFSVRDEGAGIAPEKQGSIFQRFERAVSSRNISGLGLGLYISKQIVEAHHGSIYVESQLGQGTTFTVDLPIL